MKSLVDILRDEGVPQLDSVDGLRRTVANTIPLYLQDRPVLMAPELLLALREVLDAGPSPSHFGTYSDTFCTPGGNQYIKTSIHFHAITLGDTVGQLFKKMHPRSKILLNFHPLGVYHNLGRGGHSKPFKINTSLYYCDADKLNAFLRECLSTYPIRVTYSFDLRNLPTLRH